MGEFGKQLIALEREEERLLEDAEAERQKLLALTSFADIDGLAALRRQQREIEIAEATAGLRLCAKRAAGLLDERVGLTTA